MKILMAVPHFPPRRVGGIEWETLRVAKALQALGHRVRIVCIEEVDRGNQAGALHDETRLRWMDDEHEGIAVRRLFLRLGGLPPRVEYDNALVGAAVERLIAEDRPDLLHLASGYLLTLSPLSAARAHAVRAVVSLSDMWVLCPRIQMLRSDGSLSTAPIDPVRCVRCLAEEQRRYRIPGRVAPRLMTWFWHQHSGRIRHIEDRLAFLRGGLAGADAILCRSAFLRSMLVRAGAVAEGRVTPLTPGRSSAQAGAVAAVKSASDRLRLGYLGQIAPHKGVHVLVDAVGRLPGARLTLDLHGDWNQFPDYAREIRRAAAADARIRCRPPFAGDERLSELHTDLDVVVVPSIWYECSPNVILESFVYKTPVVASNLGGITELIEDGVDGLLFEADNAASLAATIQRFLDDRGLAARLRAGISPVRTQEDEVAELESLYSRIIAGPS